MSNPGEDNTTTKPSSCLLASLNIEFPAAALLLLGGNVLFFSSSVQTSGVIADEGCQEALEFSREVVVTLAVSYPRTLPSCS